MLRFVGNRLIESAAVLLVMSFVVYCLIGLMPGDPIDLMIAANPDLTPKDATRLKALYGLDKPIHERYWNWLSSALAGDFGYSRTYTQPALDILLPRMGNTALLMLISLALALLIAIPVGIYAALRPYTKLDYAINLLCFAGISIPSFWLALLVIILFAVTLAWFPAGGMETIGQGGFWDRAWYLALPVLVLTLHSAGGFTRYMRASMLQILRQDFIRTARAKGVGEMRVVLGHALRNSVMPVVTMVGLGFGALFSGALITETMFSWLGMGKTIYDAILGNDFNLALVGLLFATGMTLLGNFLADVCQVWIDPRVSFASLEDDR
ncbi:MAG TPA: ABC transporter permease [Rhodospirillaceae bacterium]|nr:diguanylate cyclase [Rhodospirillaceae bacterium]HAA93405.1 ABC transporter permease [Rhodospirillaceae bacterium]HAT35267.1 ABC transporter permease [Rhodospirillaceae bacterium]|tara:strand:- start:95 stop:1066 length:972 start_codon:yes stop_codon:yes gene_type:complete